MPPLNGYTRGLPGTWYCTNSLKLQWPSSLWDFWTVSITVYSSGISFKASSSKLQKCMQKATLPPLQYKGLFAPFVKIYTPQLSHWLFFSNISANSGLTLPTLTSHYLWPTVVMLYYLWNCNSSFKQISKTQTRAFNRINCCQIPVYLNMHSMFC